MSDIILAKKSEVDSVESGLNNHTSDTSNPHNVTNTQVGSPSDSEFSSLETDVNNHTTNTSNPHNVTAAQADAVATSDIGTTVAGLDNGTVPESQLPALAISETFVLSSGESKTNLNAQEGDVAIENDTSTSYILQGDDPTVESNWVELKSPTSEVDSVFGRTGAVTAESGDYDVSQITNAASDSDVSGVQSNLDSHTSDTTNPHNVTNSQVGAPSDSDFSSLETSVNSHHSNTSNPHSTTLESARVAGNTIGGDIIFNNDFSIGDDSTTSLSITNAAGDSGWFFNEDGTLDTNSLTSDDVTATSISATNQLDAPSFATEADVPTSVTGFYYVEGTDDIHFETGS